MQTDTISVEIPSEFKLRVHFESDWHIGQGAGRPGDVDRLVHRDTDGFPWIPAKTLTGMLRDSCERVALGLDNGQQDDRKDRPYWIWVNYIFGEQPALNRQARLESPRPASLSIRAARLPSELRAALVNRPLIREAMTFVKPGVKIDARSGGAKEKHLHFDEIVRGGVVLESECRLELPADPAERKLIFALLLAGASLLERLGGKRRRGSGKCHVDVIPAVGRLPTRDTWVGWLEKAGNTMAAPREWTEALAPVSSPSQPNHFEVSENEQENGWMAIEIRLHAKTPLVIPAQTIGNMVETLDYVPGTYLLPLVSRLLDRADIPALTAISRGDVIVAHATPEVDGSRGLPVPLALFHRKGTGGLDEGHGVWNRMVESDPSRGLSADCPAPLRNHRVGWLAAEGPSLPVFGVIRRISLMHNTIEDGPQRPTTGVGGLYSYEAIAPGTVLRAVVRLRCSIVHQLRRHREDWWMALTEPTGELNLGRARKDEYGRVRIEVLDKPRLLTHARQDASRLVLWLQSHVLLRDSYLRPCTDSSALMDTLSKRLNVKLSLVNQEQGVYDALLKTARIESWQTRWGLPRPSLLGLSAGSCLLLESEPPVAGAAIAALELEGIGERRAEGYGQVIINAPLLEEATSSKVRAAVHETRSSRPLTKIHSQSEDRALLNYARLLERSALKAAIERKAQSKASDRNLRLEMLGMDIKGGKSDPSLSQLGTLRARFGWIKSSEGLTRFRDWLNKVTGRTEGANRKEYGIKPVAEKVLAMIDDPVILWRNLELEELEPYVVTDDGADVLKSELHADGILCLLLSGTAQHKREVERNTGGRES